jgi:hypothetical protein
MTPLVSVRRLLVLILPVLLAGALAVSRTPPAAARGRRAAQSYDRRIPHREARGARKERDV